MAKRTCSICAHPDRAPIDSQLAGGMFQSDIAEKFQVSRFALSRHWRRCLAVPESSTSETLEVQAARWMQRADEIYAASTASGDVRGQVQSLTAAFRGLELQHRAEQHVAQAASDADTEVGAIDISQVDRLLEEHGAKLLEEIAALVAQRQNRREDEPFSQNQ